MKLATKLATLLAALALPLALAQPALALGTPAGTVVTNRATLDYTVGGIGQPTANSTQTTFNVDRKVNFNVSYIGSFVDVFPGASDQALRYRVTNTGNDTHDFALTVAQLSGGSVLGATDNIDANQVRLFRDNGDEAFGVGDTEITAPHYLDELAPDDDIVVFVVGDFPNTMTNGQVAGLTLTAQALYGHSANNAGGAILGGVSDTKGTVAGSVIYTVFADVGLDNLEQVAGAFRIIAPVLSIDKNANLIWDPVNYNGANKRNIPGAFVQYVITISNSGSPLMPAQLTTIQDSLNVNTTLDPDFVGTALDTGSPLPSSAAGLSFMVTHTSGRAGSGTPSYYGSGGPITVSGQAITANLAALLPAGAGYAAGELRAGESVSIAFNVKIN